MACLGCGRTCYSNTPSWRSCQILTSLPPVALLVLITLETLTVEQQNLNQSLEAAAKRLLVGWWKRRRPCLDISMTTRLAQMVSTSPKRLIWEPLCTLQGNLQTRRAGSKQMGPASQNFHLSNGVISRLKTSKLADL